MTKITYILVALYILISPYAKAQTDAAGVTLSQCIESALTYNPNIKAANNDVVVATIGVKAARSGLYPAVSLDASGGLSNEYQLGNNYKTGTAKLAADQLLWQNKKVSAVMEQARYLGDASESSLEARKQEVILSVKTTFFTCLQQQQYYLIAIDNVSKAELFLEYARELFKTGTGRKSDVLKAESDLAEAMFDRDVYLNSLKRAQNELAMLTGISTDMLTQLKDSLQNNQSNSFSVQPDSLFARAIRVYPELQSINSIGLSQLSKIKETRSDFYPRFSVSAGYDWNYTPALQEQKGWYSVLALRWNIFSGKERSYRLQSEKVRKDIYDNQAEEIKSFLQKEVNNRLISIKEAETQIALTRSLMKTTSENLEIAKAQYKAGTGSLLELTDARLADLSARQRNIQAITAFRIALANLERLIGTI